MTADEAGGLARLQRETFARSGAATTSSYPEERRLSGDALHRVLTSPRYATVASTRPDGRPHAAPVAFVLSWPDIWLPTVAGAVRARNVRTRPWLVLVVAEGAGEQHMAVIGEGPVSVSPDLPGHVRPAVDRQLRAFPEWAEEWLVLRPERLLSYAAPGWAP